VLKKRIKNAELTYTGTSVYLVAYFDRIQSDKIAELHDEYKENDGKKLERKILNAQYQILEDNDGGLPTA